MCIEVLPYFILKNSEVDVILIAAAGDSNGVAEIVNGFGGIASPAHSVDGEYAGIVPAAHPVGEDQLVELALGKHGVCDVEPRVLPHVRPVDVESFQYPVVQFSSDFELERAEGMSDAFETVADGMCVVVEGIDAPLLAHVRVRVEFNAINHRVTQCRIHVLVVDLRPQ